jgi:hypothetical protein
MVHCGFEGTAATDTIRHPLKLIKVAHEGRPHRWSAGPMAPRPRMIPAEQELRRSASPIPRRASAVIQLIDLESRHSSSP